MYAFKQGLQINGMEIMEEYPAKVAEMLLENEIDVGLVPVAIIPKLTEHYIISDYCIGAERQVDRCVCLVRCRLIRLKSHFRLPKQNIGSACKILIKQYWKICR